MSAEGAARFARYAYPPNALGFCGPAGASAMLAPGATEEIGRRARRFEGAWSYLEVLAETTGRDPLDTDVVEAYWVGGDLLRAVDGAGLVERLAERFVGQVGGTWREAAARATAHHGFQVYEVYPWAGLLLAGRPPGPAVNVLDRCRIRVGEVVAVDGERVVVSSRPLVWDGTALHEAQAVTETACWSVDGQSLIGPPAVGNLVALHWDWVCEVVTSEAAASIEDLDRRARSAVGLSPAGR
ncbi:MAG: DUF6390 family protein [Nocardioidaceae bacterium]